MAVLWRWIESDEEADPAHAMALDKAVFEAVGERIVPPTVRVYRWRNPAVTVGRLQDFDEARRNFPGLAIARRQTGGKAVLHGDDLTVTLAACEAELLAPTDRRGVLASYGRILCGIEAAYRRCGVDTQRGTTDAARVGADCFARTGRVDLCEASRGVKLAGCAQLRRSGFVLQQMSLRSFGQANVQSKLFLRFLQEELEHSLGISCSDPARTVTQWEQERVSVLLTGAE